MEIKYTQILQMLGFNVLVYILVGSPSILFWVFMPLIYLVVMFTNLLFIGAITNSLHFNGKKVTFVELVKILWESIKKKCA